MIKRHLLSGAVGLLVLVASACGAGAAADKDPEPSTDSACLVGSTDCADDPSADFPIDEARDHARGVLGLGRADLTGDIRIGRIGDEPQVLTEDYQLGRLTVALDDTDGSGLRVVEVTVEMPSGPETYQLEPS